jgi:hypothetical protein
MNKKSKKMGLVKIKRITILALLSVLVLSTVSIAGHASAVSNFTPPSNLKMGSFVADPQVTGGNASQLGKWFSMSWGINQAYSVGAVDYPYQFLYGNFYQNGQEVVQPIQVEFTINWTAVRAHEEIVTDGSWTGLGAPTWTTAGVITAQGAFSTGLVDSLYNNRVHVFFIQNSTLEEYNVTTAQGQSTYPVPSFYPTSAVNGSFFIVVQVAYAMWHFGEGWGTNEGYRTIYVGEGEFNALNSHVSGTPTTVVNSQLTGAAALLNWTFSAGEWNATFVHYLNNNPSDTSSSNIQILQYDNFTYKQTGGMAHLKYNFTSSQPSGVYGWRFYEGITDYGTSFIVYNNITVQQSGDRPPMISIYIKSAKQGQTEQISIYAKDAKNSSIFLEISVWYGNDIYTVPDPSYENVIYYFAPANVTSGTNYSLPSFTNSFYGELNVEVLSENIYHEWNNSYASSVVISNVFGNGSFHYPPTFSWFVSPISGPLNFIFLLGGIGLFIYSVHESGLEGRERRLRMQGFDAPLMDIRTHYLAAIILLIFAFINWSIVLTTITSWRVTIP